MPLTNEEIKKIAALARLKLTPAEIERYRRDFSSILKYVDQLATVKTPQSKKRTRITTRLRLDDTNESPLEERELAWQQASQREERQLKVKRIL